MPDVGRTHPDPQGVPVGDALSALPLEAPPRSAWPALAAQRPRPGRSPRWPFAFATAAALALAFLLPVPQGNGPDLPGTPLATTDARPLSELMRESARLESLISAADADPLKPADALVLGLAFEDELASIDAALAAEAPGGSEVDALWQARVEVLGRYAALQLAHRAGAAEGRPFDNTLVALH